MLFKISLKSQDYIQILICNSHGALGKVHFFCTQIDVSFSLLLFETCGSGSVKSTEGVEFVVKLSVVK